MQGVGIIDVSLRCNKVSQVGVEAIEPRCGIHSLVGQKHAQDPARCATCRLPVGLGNTLELVLLLDRVRVGGSLGGVDDLVSKALGNGLHVTEGRLAGALGEEVDGLVHPAHGRHIHSLPAHNTTAANTRGVLTGGGVDDGVHQLLDRVGVGKQVDDLEGVLDDADRHHLQRCGT
eukprot:2543343-Rhodomonas_salina.1